MFITCTTENQDRGTSHQRQDYDVKQYKFITYPDQGSNPGPSDLAPIATNMCLKPYPLGHLNTLKKVIGNRVMCGQLFIKNCSAEFN